MIPAPDTIRVEDDCAGPGGWDHASALLGLHPIGYEVDAAACATARAAGHVRVQTDMTKRRPSIDLLNGAKRFYLYMASPPCQGFSFAGLGKGRSSAATTAILRGVDALAEGATYAQAVGYVVEACDDPRVPLVLWPLSWALKMRPENIAWEQVPTVLPLWEAMADVLCAHGYSTDTGLLQAEQYDTPQTRKRAILIASRTHPVALPAPVRRKYRKGISQDGAIKGQEHLAPWLSMADALGWGGATLARNAGPGAQREPRPSEEPAYTIRANGSGSHPSGVEWSLRSNYGTGGDASNRGRRGGDEPAPTVTSHVDRNLWQYVNGNQANSARRPLGEPAPTVHFAERQRMVEWQMCAGGVTSQDTAGAPPRASDQPAATITGKGTAAWQMTSGTRPNAATRHAAEPAPTLALGHDAASYAITPTGVPPQELVEHKRTSSVRVTVQEAALLQGFPPDYPWHGTKTAQYRQVGDAVPPPLAWHVLRAALGMPVESYPAIADTPQEVAS